jgi:hypothetical protein
MYRLPTLRDRGRPPYSQAQSSYHYRLVETSSREWRFASIPRGAFGPLQVADLQTLWAADFEQKMHYPHRCGSHCAIGGHANTISRMIACTIRNGNTPR